MEKRLRKYVQNISQLWDIKWPTTHMHWSPKDGGREMYLEN